MFLLKHKQRLFSSWLQRYFLISHEAPPPDGEDKPEIRIIFNKWFAL